MHSNLKNKYNSLSRNNIYCLVTEPMKLWNILFPFRFFNHVITVARKQVKSGVMQCFKPSKYSRKFYSSRVSMRVVLSILTSKGVKKKKEQSNRNVILLFFECGFTLNYMADCWIHFCSAHPSTFYQACEVGNTFSHNYVGAKWIFYSCCSELQMQKGSWV
jgi:hypothetical protein